MHCLYFVKVDEATDEIDAQGIAVELLDDNNFASCENGFYGNSKADWYQVGGRWGGLFTDYTEVENRIRDIIKDDIRRDDSRDIMEYLQCNPHMISNEKREEIEKVSKEITGYGYFENQKNTVKITKEILEKIKKEYGDVEVAIIEGGACIEDEILAKDIDDSCIGQYLTVIDYHN